MIIPCIYKAHTTQYLLLLRRYVFYSSLCCFSTRIERSLLKLPLRAVAHGQCLLDHFERPLSLQDPEAVCKPRARQSGCFQTERVCLHYPPDQWAAIDPAGIDRHDKSTPRALSRRLLYSSAARGTSRVDGGAAVVDSSRRRHHGLAISPSEGSTSEKTSFQKEERRGQTCKTGCPLSRTFSSETNKIPKGIKVPSSVSRLMM
ncbi:uncharacterized protein LOC103305902 [Chrysemys picta bellii]|uniref:uncharacterized protein LOC103305902 n=1 Tax=Chrysemys picta bellii TaxID=8478 RepID=UPI0032B1BD48